MMRWATRMGGLVESTLNMKELAEETGGEVLEDKPDQLDKTFTTLLGTYVHDSVGSTHKQTRDGSVRKLKVET